MYQKSILALFCLALTACGDPLADFERLSDVPLAEDPTGAQVVTDPTDTPPVLFGGLFSRTTAQTTDAEPGTAVAKGTPLLARSAADSNDVPLGSALPFGQVASVCAAKGTKLGKEIDRFPKRGSGYRLYDTNPTTTAPRTFYVTGFRDGCPRQFTAALAIFGAPSMHEQIRYGLPGQDHPYSATDKAYEGVKAKMCGKPKGKPCGSRIKSLERNTVFISTYEHYGDTARWADMLVHDGAVLAKTIKSN